MITTINNQTASTSSVARAASTDGASELLTNSVDKATSLGKDDFLKLLIAQLKNQDPLNPTNNTEFVAQLAQFSSLEQMTQMNENLGKNLENTTRMSEAVGNSMIINYLGKEVTAELASIMYDGTNPAELKFNLDGKASTVQITIKDAADMEVGTFALDSGNAGLNRVEWDGYTKFGAPASSGKYTYEINAYDILGNEISGTPVFSGVVEGITYVDGIAQLSVNGILLPYNQVNGIIDN